MPCVIMLAVDHILYRINTVLKLLQNLRVLIMSILWYIMGWSNLYENTVKHSVKATVLRCILGMSVQSCPTLELPL